ncbi:MAG: cation:proton antiporter [Candidatus Latescibacterota bacterium]
MLLALAAVVVAGRLLSRLFHYLRQPPVIGEVVAGILLGPSLLGHLWPSGAAFPFPAAIVPHLGVLAQVGVVLYMFVVGLELDVGELRRRGSATAGIAQAGMAVPFVLGAGLALVLYPVLSTSAVPFTRFALFLGAALSVTAFPVLARILSDYGQARSPLGTVALGAAALSDVVAWCLLAFVVGVAQAQLGGALATVALTLAYIGVMWLLVRRALLRCAPHWLAGPLDRGVLAGVLVGLLLSAVATELIGVHAIFGAFLCGAVIPHDSGVARELTRRLEDFVTVLLLPAFFAFTGLRTQLGLLAGAENWLLCGVVVLVASAGKWGGPTLDRRRPLAVRVCCARP